MRTCADARLGMEEASGVYRRAVKKAKQDGVNTRQLAAALAAKKHDVDKVRGNLRDYVRYLSLVNMPVHQGDLFGSGAEPAAPVVTEGEHAEWEAGTAGRSAGRAGADRSINPHEPGSATFAAWDKSWTSGQESIAAEMTTKVRGGANGGRRKRRDEGAAGLQ
jgi:hypothetical protein